MKELSDRQKLIVKLIRENLDSPLTYRELAAKVGLKSSNTIHHHIKQLKKKGALPRSYCGTAKRSTRITKLKELVDKLCVIAMFVDANKAVDIKDDIHELVDKL